MKRRDIDARHDGSLVLLFPETDRAAIWLATNIDPEAPSFGPAIVVEPRYAGPVIAGARRDGLTVEVTQS